jgi:hypothetical protein
MIKLKDVSIAYHMVGEGEDEMLMVMIHFRLYIDEIISMVGVNLACGVDFFLDKHKADKDDEIVKLFDNRFKNALVGFIKRKRLEIDLITENLISDANDCIWKCVDYFSENGKPYVINLEE